MAKFIIQILVEVNEELAKELRKTSNEDLEELYDLEDNEKVINSVVTLNEIKEN